MDHKETLHRYLRRSRDDLLAKLDGLDEYDVRRPMTRTGTSLLGLVKHVASVELGYFTDVFDRPSGRSLPWDVPGAELDADMWATADESRAEIVEMYQFANEQADATIAALDLDSPGRVPWWPEERRDTTLQFVLVHMLFEAARHAGHADIVRELIDGSAGMSKAIPNMAEHSTEEWTALHDKIEAAARQAAGRS
jgi:uncharacterized damage-inducible protein DinB